MGRRNSSGIEGACLGWIQNLEVYGYSYRSSLGLCASKLQEKLWPIAFGVNNQIFCLKNTPLVEGAQVVVLGSSPHHGTTKVADEAFGDAIFFCLLKSLFHLVNVLSPVNQSNLI